MRLSDAMALGSTFVKMSPGDFNHCPLGAAARAIGIDTYKNGLIPRLFAEWPWLETKSPAGVLYLTDIAQMFDQQVCKLRMTREQFVSYVRSIEPPCECGIYNCCCKRVEPLLAAASDEVDSAVYAVPF